MTNSESLRQALADLPLALTKDDLQDLPEGSIIFCETSDSVGECMFLVKDECEMLFLGSPCEWFAFDTKSCEIILMDDVFPVLPAIIIVRGLDR